MVKDESFSAKEPKPVQEQEQSNEDCFIVPETISNMDKHRMEVQGKLLLWIKSNQFDIFQLKGLDGDYNIMFFILLLKVFQ